MPMDTTIRLLQFTDCHLFADPAGQLRGVTSLESLKATIAAARSRHAPWQATLLTGDLVQDDPGGYAHIRDVFGSFAEPVYCLPGNHDLPDQMRSELAGTPFSQAGTVRIRDWLLVMLDSTVPGRARGALAAAEIDRLRAALSARDYAHALVCLHHQPVGMNSRWLDQVGLDNAAGLWEAIDAEARVRGVVWGHVHQAYDGGRGAVHLLGTPSTCAQFKPNVDAFTIDRAPPAYRWLDLAADGVVHSAVEWATRPASEAAAQSA